MKKLVIYTCVIGNYDPILSPSAVWPEADYVYFTDNPVADNVWDMRPISHFEKDGHMTNRWYKMHPSELFPDYEYSLWIDGNLRITNSSLYDRIEHLITEESIYAGVMHPSRNDVYDEANKILSNGRDSFFRLAKTVMFLKKENFPGRWGLFEANIILRRSNNESVLECDRLWWEMVNRFSIRDQMSQSYCLWKTGIHTDYLLPPGENAQNSPCFEYHHHGKIYVKDRSFSGRYKDALAAIKIILFRLFLYITGVRRGWLIKNIVSHFPWLLSDRRFVELIWKQKYGRDLNLDNPLTFNEKIQWLKVFDQREDYFIMADKIEAKRYAASIIGQEHIIPTIGIYDSVSDIVWDNLPQKFVMKCSHDSGGLVVCRDKKALNKNISLKKLSDCLKTNYFYNSREWCYKGIKPRILCERFMEDEFQQEGLIDYKFFCFSGEPEFLYISSGLENHRTASISFTYMDGRRAPFHRADYKEVADPLPIPASFEEMKIIARKLAKAINNPFIRVDLYEINSVVYFSELTFYPNSGYIPFVPAEWDRKLGDLIKL